MPYQFIFSYFFIFFIIGMGMLSYVSYYGWHYKFIRGAKDKNSAYNQSQYKKPLGSNFSCLSLPVVGLGGVGYPGEVEDFMYDSVTLCVKNPDAWVLGLLVLAGAVYGRLWGLSESEWNPRTSVVGKYFELYTEVALQAGKLLGEAKNSSLGKSLRRVLTAMAVGMSLMFLCPVLCVGIVWCLVADSLLEALAFVIFFGLNLMSFAVGLFAKAVIWLGNSFVALRGILRGSVTSALSFLSGLTSGFHHWVRVAMGMAPEETLEDEDLVHVLMGLYLVLILLLGVGFFTWGVQVGLGVETVSVVSDIWSINLP